MLIIVAILLLGFVGPWVYPVSPTAFSGKEFLGPGPLCPLGTDSLGRDILAQVLSGARVSFMVGFFAVSITLLVGITIGAIGGYVSGKTDMILMRITDAFLTIPVLMLSLILVAILGANIWNIILVIAGLSWMKTARLVRAEFLSLREREFVLAAKGLGFPSRQIIFGEILPNGVTSVIVNASFELGQAILREASLSFLGLGDPSNISWGYMMYSAFQFLRVKPLLSILPGSLIFITVLSLNLLGDALNEVLSPYRS
jgi:peptide/nickel transport system permease protein